MMPSEIVRSAAIDVAAATLVARKDGGGAGTTPEGIPLRPAVTFFVEIHPEGRVREFDAEEAELAKVLAKRKSR